MCAQPRRLKVVKKEDSDRFEVLFENASDALMVVDLATGIMTSVNLRMQELTGYLKTELEGKPVALLTPHDPKAHPRSPSFSPQLLEYSGFHEETILEGKDGICHFVSLSVKTMTLQGRDVAMCILRDIGEKKNMERELITKHTELRNAYVSLEKANADLKAMQETLVQSGKLAALGELAAGVAHELNQPLTAIKGFAQETATCLNTQDIPTAQTYLKEIIHGADKMHKIISHLRNFTRKSTEDSQWVDVHQVIEESLLMLDKQFKSRGIKIERRYATSLPKVYCNPFQLEQVFINLATNARDAIEAKQEKNGIIRITTETSTAVVVPGNPAIQVVHVKYEDNGCGIPESAKSKIFNPFFTTKEVGKGMGLGLSISYGILSRIHASIFVESQQRKGAVFTVKLPIDYRNL